MFNSEIHRRVRLLSGVVLLLLIILSGCKGAAVVPQHLIGVWENPASQYADRYMKFTEHTLAYGIGEGKEVSYEIIKIDMEHAGGGTLFTFHYKDSEGYKCTLTFTYSPDARTVQIKNSTGIWKQTKPGGS